MDNTADLEKIYSEHGRELSIIYMTNGHPDRAWNRHVCFDIFCFVPFRYIRFAKLHSHAESLLQKGAMCMYLI
jgi:hypothetical protein